MEQKSHLPSSSDHQTSLEAHFPHLTIEYISHDLMDFCPEVCDNPLVVRGFTVDFRKKIYNIVAEEEAGIVGISPEFPDLIT